LNPPPIYLLIIYLFRWLDDWESERLKKVEDMMKRRELREEDKSEAEWTQEIWLIEQEKV
jgi:hypothetical protein